MKNFIKQHKFLIIPFILFSLTAVYSWSKISNNQFSISNQFSIVNDQTTTTSQNHDITTPPSKPELLVTSYELLVTNSSTVLEAMRLASADSKKPFLFKTKTFSGLGEFVEEINGLKNNPQENKYWIYYLNGKSAKLGISTQVVKPGDVIEWKFEKSNF